MRARMIKYTAKGQPYVEREGVRDFGHLSIKCDLDQIERCYGVGIRLYFIFLKFVIGWNALIAVVGIISWAIATSQSQLNGWTTLFVSNYVDSTYTNWFATNVLIFCGWFLFGVVYWIWEKFAFVEKKGAATNDDQITENQHHTTRYVLGVLLTLCYLVGCCAVFYGLLVAQKYVSDDGSNDAINLVMGIPVSLSFVLSTTVWDILSYKVTYFERCKTWSHFRMSQALKLIIFKVCAATVMYTLVPFVLTTTTTSCILQSSATNYFIVLTIDTFIVMVFVKMLAPIIIRRITGRKELPEFNVSDHLLQLIYRQFIIYIGFIIFPLIGILGLVAIILQFIIDRIELLRLCQDPQIIRDHIGNFLLAFCLISAMAAFVTYPNGALWMLFLPNLLPANFRNCTIIFFSSN